MIDLFGVQNQAAPGAELRRVREVLKRQLLAFMNVLRRATTRWVSQRGP